MSATAAVTMAMQSINPFDSLPIEIVQHVASYLEADESICRFRLICRSTLAAVEGDNYSFWRRRFLATFDGTKDAHKYESNLKYRRAYQARKTWLKNGAKFLTGETRREVSCLEMLKDLIIESYGTPDGSQKVVRSLNIEHIKRFLKANNLLHVVFIPHVTRKRSSKRYKPAFPTPLLHTLQVLMAPYMLTLSPDLAGHHYGFPDSQYVAYSTDTARPIFVGCNSLDVDMQYVLHQLNFWKYHMCRKIENTLFASFSELEDFEKPGWWMGPLSQARTGSGIGRLWKGSYAFVERDQIHHIRRGQGECNWIQDRFAGEDNYFDFQGMELEKMADQRRSTWPKLFEKNLQSLRPPISCAKTRAQRRSASFDADAEASPPSFPTAATPPALRFTGVGTDASDGFDFDGWLTPLPLQHGVPGWQRMTAMKTFVDTNTGGVDLDALWAYEGVVLPGGRIILGRWWNPVEGDTEPMFSGPFILWCVDPPSDGVAAA